MPAKNSTNPAKTPIFPRFMPNVPSPVQQVRTKSLSTEIIENSDVLVAARPRFVLFLAGIGETVLFFPLKVRQGK